MATLQDIQDVQDSGSGSDYRLYAEQAAADSAMKASAPVVPIWHISVSKDEETAQRFVIACRGDLEAMAHVLAYLGDRPRAELTGVIYRIARLGVLADGTSGMPLQLISHADRNTSV